jgi:hypothetical protein
VAVSKSMAVKAFLGIWWWRVVCADKERNLTYNVLD